MHISHLVFLKIPKLWCHLFWTFGYLLTCIIRTIFQLDKVTTHTVHNFYLNTEMYVFYLKVLSFFISPHIL